MVRVLPETSWGRSRPTSRRAESQTVRFVRKCNPPFELNRDSLQGWIGQALCQIG
jgi:hypothetical protein